MDNNQLIVIDAGSMPTLIAADKADILGKLKAELDGYTPDASTPAGRTEANAKAKKVGTAKMDFVHLAATITEDAKAMISGVRAEVKTIEERCDQIRDQILAGNEAYKAIEAARVAEHEQALADIKDYVADGPEETSVALALRISELGNWPKRDWQEFSQRAADVLAAEIASASKRHAEAVRRETEAAEA